MDIQHQIVSFDPQTGSMVVRFFNDVLTDGYIYNIDIPITNGAYPTEQELETLIEHHKPREQFVRIAAAKSLQAPSYLAAFVVAPQESPFTAEQARALRNARLSDSDWTQLDDAPLSVEQVQAWAAYRQELRDVPNQSGFPTEIIWPLSPAEEPR